jgi:hypothetical protein
MPPDNGCRETIKQLRAKPTGRTYDELAEILGRYGFAPVDRKRGVNRMFSREDCLQKPALPPGKRPLKALYVRQVIQALQECCDD